jgi:hypothetical protein
MKPSTVWIAIVLLALGICGILDAAGIVDTSQTIAQWWPIAIVGWAVTAMIGERRVTLGGVVCAAIGMTLLADAQEWASGAAVWSALAITLGLAILVDAGRRRGERHNGGASAAPGNGAS